MRSKTTLTLATAAASVAALLLLAVPVGADLVVQEVTFDPDPPVAWEPFTIDVEADGCAPATAVRVSVNITQTYTDVMSSVEVAAVDTVSDGSGNISVKLPVPAAYPGQWRGSVVGNCDHTPDLPGFTFEIPSPADFTFSAAGDVRRGEPFSVQLSGTGCPSGEVTWDLGAAALPLWSVSFAGGTAATVDGAWEATATGTVPADFEFDERYVYDYLQATAVCEVAGITVSYTAEQVPLLAGQTTTTTGAREIPSAAPRFAG